VESQEFARIHQLALWNLLELILAHPPSFPAAPESAHVRPPAINASREETGTTVTSMRRRTKQQQSRQPGVRQVEVLVTQPELLHQLLPPLVQKRSQPSKLV